MTHDPTSPEDVSVKSRNKMLDLALGQAEERIATLEADNARLTTENSREFQRGYDACTAAIETQAKPMSQSLLETRREVERLKGLLREAREQIQSIGFCLRIDAALREQAKA